VALNPSAVPGTIINFSPFIWADRLLRYKVLNHARKPRVSVTPVTKTGVFLGRSAGTPGSVCSTSSGHGRFDIRHGCRPTTTSGRGLAAPRILLQEAQSCPRKYSAYDRELLAIYEAVRHFRHMLEARHFTILTEHKPLISTFQQKRDKCFAETV
jgi:hypothetical protein